MYISEGGDHQNFIQNYRYISGIHYFPIYSSCTAFNITATMQVVNKLNYSSMSQNCCNVPKLFGGFQEAFHCLWVRKLIPFLVQFFCVIKSQCLS